MLKKNNIMQLENQFVMDKLYKISQSLVAVGTELYDRNPDEKAVDDIHLIMDDVIEAMEYILEHDLAKVKKVS